MLDPEACAKTVSILVKVASEANTWDPADAWSISVPPPPSKTSELPSPEDAMVKVSALPPPFNVSPPEPLIILNPLLPPARPVSYTHLTLPTICSV